MYNHNFIRNNLTVQERLFDRMDDLLELDVAIPDMAEVLTEVGHCIQNRLIDCFTLSI